MSKAEILTQLKSAEEQAKERRAQAEGAARQTVAAARREASTIVENARGKATTDARAKVDQAASEVAGEANAMRAAGERSAAGLKTSAEKHVGAATAYLVKEFERYVDVRAAKNG